MEPPTGAPASGTLRSRRTRPCPDHAPPAPVPAVRTVIYYGSAGAFSHMACRQMFPEARLLPGGSLSDAVEAVRGGVEAAVVPCENLIAGRVPDIHLGLPDIGLAIIGEIFLPIELHLVGKAGVPLERIRRVHSHPVALRQVRKFMSTHGFHGVEAQDTASAALAVKATGDPAEAAIASELAAELHGLQILRRNIEDQSDNMTRFYVLAPDLVLPPSGRTDTITSLVFQVRNTPGALVRAMNGFAEQGINLTKLESYLGDGDFVATRFHCEFEGHPEHSRVADAIEELKRHTHQHKLLGVFPMHAGGPRRRADSGRLPGGSHMMEGR